MHETIWNATVKVTIHNGKIWTIQYVDNNDYKLIMYENATC